MTTQNENANYDYQSFDHYTTAPMLPFGWDMSALHPAPKTDSVTDLDSSTEIGTH